MYLVCAALQVRKSHLTADEISVLHLTPSPVSANRAIALPFARACVSICWDGFWPDVLRNLDAQGCALLLHPTWNNGVWQGDSQPGVWQAEDWISGPFGTVQPACKNLAVNVNAMITGNLFDMVVDGQSAIVARSAQTPKPLYAGTELSNSSVASNWTATVLAMAPWAIEDPGRAHPQYSLQQRRDILGAHAKLLLPDSGQFCSWACCFASVLCLTSCCGVSRLAVREPVRGERGVRRRARVAAAALGSRTGGGA